jgi:Cof subfamily protein (haloacid dehalogenase superfamily)
VATRTLYVTDLDGTLLGDDHRLSPNTLAIINELVADGMLFTVATGRSLPPTELVLRGLDLRVPIICNNGGVIFDPVTRTTVRRLGLDPDRAQRYVLDLVARGLHPIVFTTDADGEHHAHHLGVFNIVEDRYITNRIALGDKRFRLVPDFTDAFAEHVISLSAIDLHHRLVPALDANAGDPGIYQVLYVDDRNPGFSWLEILNVDANKGAGVRFLRDHLGVDRVVCFGDQANDVPMFAVADESYAVAGAQAEFRAAATGVIGSNTDDAVARYLKDSIRV